MIDETDNMQNIADSATEWFQVRMLHCPAITLGSTLSFSLRTHTGNHHACYTNGKSCVIMRTVVRTLLHTWQHGDTKIPTFELCKCGFIVFLLFVLSTPSELALSLSMLL